MKIKLISLLVLLAPISCQQLKEPQSSKIEWGLIGCLVKNPWVDDIPMTKEGEWYVVKGAQFTDLAFKIRANKEWRDDTNIGILPEAAPRYINESINVITSKSAIRDYGSYCADIQLYGYAGTYDVYFNSEKMEVYVMEEGFKPGDRGSLGPLGVRGHELYVIGDATDISWKLDQMKPFAYDDGIYTWIGTLKANMRYRFPLQRDWWPSLCLSEDGTMVNYATQDTEETVYYVPQDGVYTITLDLGDWNKRAAKVEYTDVMGSPLPLSEIYIIGDATDAGWSLERMFSFTEDNGIWQWTGHLKAGKRYRFPTQKAYWPSLCLSEDGTMIEYKNLDSEETVYFVPEDGVYTIILDLRNWENRSAIVKKIG